jgi:hypothetical protein
MERMRKEVYDGLNVQIFLLRREYKRNVEGDYH